MQKEIHNATTILMGAGFVNVVSTIIVKMVQRNVAPKLNQPNVIVGIVKIKMLIKNIQDFKIAMQKYHLDKPKLSLGFDDSLPDEIKELWRDMDKAILKLIWEINKCK